MGKLKILTALLLAAALTACGDDSDVFYTTSYPVARIEISVSLTEPEKPDPENPDPENPDPENPDPENPDPENPDTGTSQTEEPENPLLEEIRNDALAKAPVRAAATGSTLRTTTAVRSSSGLRPTPKPSRAHS